MIHENNEDEQEEQDNPWFDILYSIGAFGFAYYLYDYCNTLEQTGNSMHSSRSKWLVALLYNLGGKWTPTILFLLVGFGFLYFGVKGLRKQKSSR